MARRGTVFVADDLETLPLPPETLWVRRTRSNSFVRRAPPVLVMVALFLAVVAPVVDQIQRSASVQGDSTPQALAGSGPSAKPTTAGTTAMNAADWSCPAGQSPLLEHLDFPASPGDAPGTGAASAEAAFRARRPYASGVTMIHPFGMGPTAPVWILSGNETFIAELHGTPDGNNWFAYPARVIGCRAP